MMFLLNSLNLKGLEIKEEEVELQKTTKETITNLFKTKKITAFASIDDPLAWQKQQREEW